MDSSSSKDKNLDSPETEDQSTPQEEEDIATEEIDQPDSSSEVEDEADSKPKTRDEFIEDKETDLSSSFDTKDSHNSSLMGWIIAAVVILGLIGLIYFFISNSKPDKPVVTEVKDVVKEEVEEPILNKDEWTFEVLNGSGVKGAAKELADKLIELGYQVVKTGNADNSDYEETQLYISKELMDKSDLLLEDLKDELNISSVSGELEESDSTASARIIIGKDEI